MNHKSLKLALTLPFFEQIENPKDLVFSGDLANLGAILTGLLGISFYIAGFLAFYFLIWGAFQYIIASGDKEQLQKARARITWALVGLVVIFVAYFVAKFAWEIFPPIKGGVLFW